MTTSARVIILLAFGGFMGVPTSAHAQIERSATELTESSKKVPGRCGTFQVIRLIEELDTAYVNRLLQEQPSLESIFAVAGTRPQMQQSIVSQDGHFRIHFDSTGSNAPDPVDRNANGVPDYIDSVGFYMEYAWEVEIDHLGWATPPPDNTHPSSGGIDGRIDVYVRDLDSKIYGFAVPDLNGRIDSRRVPAYLVVDNDYVGYPTSGIDGLRVTCAHEFHHVVQFSAYIYAYSQSALYEATATLMEFLVHPDVTDYRLYFEDFLQAPQDYPFSRPADGASPIGYAHMHYLLSIMEQVDESVTRSIWDHFKANGKSYDAIDEALIEAGDGLNLSNSYCTFANWSYHTGKNAGDTSLFKDAHLYPSMAAARTASLDRELPTILVDSLPPLTFGLYRVHVPHSNSLDPDTIEFLVTNARDNLGSGGGVTSEAEEFTLRLSVDEREGYIPVEYSAGRVYYSLASPHTNFCVRTYLNGSPGVIVSARPTPQPFINDGANEMVFALKIDESSIRTIELGIYSPAMSRVVSMREDGLQTLESVRGIVWDGRLSDGQLAPTGVYVYTLTVNGSRSDIGKIAVVRK